MSQLRVVVRAPEVTPAPFKVRASNLGVEERQAAYDIARVAATHVCYSQEIADYFASIGAQIAGAVATHMAAAVVNAAAPAIVEAARASTQADAARLAETITESVRVAVESVVATTDIGRYKLSIERDQAGRIVGAHKRPEI